MTRHFLSKRWSMIKGKVLNSLEHLSQNLSNSRLGLSKFQKKKNGSVCTNASGSLKAAQPPSKWTVDVFIVFNKHSSYFDNNFDNSCFNIMSTRWTVIRSRADKIHQSSNIRKMKTNRANEKKTHWIEENTVLISPNPLFNWKRAKIQVKQEKNPLKFHFHSERVFFPRAQYWRRKKTKPGVEMFNIKSHNVHGIHSYDMK